MFKGERLTYIHPPDYLSGAKVQASILKKIPQLLFQLPLFLMVIELLSSLPAYTPFLSFTLK